MTTTKSRRLDDLKLRPTTAELRAMVNEGLPYAAIAEEYGVSENTVKSWVRRAGLATRRPRYKDTIPWENIPNKHKGEYPQRMLQLLGRRLHGYDMSGEEESKLDSFLAVLRNDGVNTYVVAYARWLMPGFRIIPGKWIKGKIPIQMEEIPPPEPGMGGKHKRYLLPSELMTID